MSDNYNAVRDHWRKRFLEMDHEALAKKFHLEINAEDYRGEDTWPEMDYKTATALLCEANKLFELVGDQNEVDEVLQYLNYIEEIAANE